MGELNMSKRFSNKGTFIVERVRSLLSDNLDRTDLLRKFDGLHPIELKLELLRSGATLEHDAVFGDLIIGRPTFHEVSREDNPALSFWPFTKSTIHEIVKVMAGFSKIALLGAPSLFPQLKSSQGGTILFDADDYFFPKSTVGFVRCDVCEIPTEFDSQFDLVFADPPWYGNEYRKWLAVADRLVRKGGTMMFVLFRNGVRPTAKVERTEIVEYTSAAYSDLSRYEKEIHYETPSFEQIQMINSGLKPFDWRCADLYIARGALKEKRPGGAIETDPKAWVEGRLGNGRLFLEMDEANDSNDKIRIECSDATRFLSSPSRRNPGRLVSNILTSRGHGLRCSNPTKFLQVFSSMHSVDDAEKSLSAFEQTSCDLFMLLVRDLWGRFIAL